MVNINKIRSLASEKGIKLSYIIEKLGLQSRTYFRDVEKSNRDIPPDKLAIIANILGTSPEYLRDESDAPPATPPQTVTDRDIKVALFGGDGEVTDEMWEEVKQFAAFVKQKNQKK